MNSFQNSDALSWIAFLCGSPVSLFLTRCLIDVSLPTTFCALP